MGHFVFAVIISHLMGLTPQQKDSCVYEIPLTNLTAFKKEFIVNVPRAVNPVSANNTQAVQAYLKKITTGQKFSIYNANENLLIPLVYAYQKNQPQLKADFVKFFNRLPIDSIYRSSVQLDKLQFSYLIAEYLRYQARDRTVAANTDYIYRFLKKFILQYWLNDKGNVWDAEVCFFKGKRSRIAYLLTHDVNEPNTQYHGAFTDFDLFTLAVGTSLASYEFEKYGKVSNEMIEFPYYFLKVLKKCAVFNTDGGWVFQPGIWTDYPDYQYAGNIIINDHLEKKEVKNIGWDVSHFSRMPGYLNTLSSLFKSQSPDGVFIAKLKKGLATQMINHVVVPPSHFGQPYLIKNFMDGTNGIFRYQYNKSRSSGYSPYGNAQHFMFGWWSLLNDARINRIYQDVYKYYSIYESNPKFRFGDPDIPDNYNYYYNMIYFCNSLNNE